AFLLVADEDLQIDDDARAKLGDDAAAVLDAAAGTLAGVDEWTHESIQAALRARLVDELGIKPRKAFGPIRTAVSGTRISPPLFEPMELLGKDSSLARIAQLRATL